MIEPFLNRPVEEHLFSPREAEEERRDAMHAARKTPVSYGNRPGTNRKALPDCTPQEHYRPDTYRTAIERACRKAGVPRWTPHRLRHNAATRLRREHGIDLAQTILGHRLGSSITEIYAEANTAKAMEVMGKVG